MNHSNEEPTKVVSDALLWSDVFFAPTSSSITHTIAVENAIQSGSRGATLPGITKNTFQKGLSPQLSDIKQNCTELMDKVKDATEIRYVTDNGTDFRYKPRYWSISSGDVSTPGDRANLPSGEIFTAPKEASGTIVFDGSMRPHGHISSDVKVEVKDGIVTQIHDDGVRSLFESAEEKAGQCVYNLAEAAIGANPAISQLTGNILLDEKAAGTVHVAIGDNSSFGGDVDAPIHEDGVIEDPDVYVDGHKIQLPEN
jgi:leucyl aminopeptidase (aminopeptidase T)